MPFEILIFVLLFDFQALCIICYMLAVILAMYKCSFAKKLKLHNTCYNAPKHVISAGVYLRGLAPEQYSSKEILQ